MKRRIKRWVTMILSLTLILGGIQYTPMMTEAREENVLLSSCSGGDVSGNSSSAEITECDDFTVVMSSENITPAGSSEDKSYTAGELEFNWASADYELVGDKYKLTFVSQYKEIKLKVPETIDMTKCNAVTFAVSEQSSPLAFKLYSASGELTGFTKYNQSGNTLYTFDTTSLTDQIVYVGVMLNQSLTNQSCTFDGVMFDMTADSGDEGDDDTETTDNITPAGSSEDKSFTAGKLTYSWANAGYSIADGKCKLTFATQYNEIRLKLPENIDLTNCSAVTFAVSEQTCPLAFKLYDTNEKELDFTKYSQSGKTLYTYELSRTETVGYVGVMMNDNMTNQSCTFDGVMFDMISGGEEDSDNITPTGTVGEDISYKATELGVAWSTAAKSETDASQLNLTFSSGAAEIRLTLPEEIDLSNCSSVTFAVSEHSNLLAFKVLDADGNELLVKYNQSGNTLYTFDLSSTATAKYVGVMHNDNSVADGTCTFDGVMFDMKAAEDEPVETNNYTVTVYPSALTKAWTNASAADMQEDNRYLVEFGSLNNEVRLNLPTSIDLANCESITFNVKDQVGPVNFYVSSGETKLKSYWYNVDKTTYVLEPVITDVIDAIGIQAGGESATDGAAVVLESVVFTMTKTAEEENQVYGEAPVDEEEPPIDISGNITPAAASDEDYSWTGNVLPEIYNTTTATFDDSVARWNLTFSGDWQEIRFKLPESVDLSLCKSITFAIPEQSAALSFKMYTDGTEVGATQYHQSGKNLYTFEISAGTDIIDAVAIMLHADDKVNGTENCSFDGVMFDMLAEDEIVETYEVSYGYSDLTYDWSNAASCQLIEGGYQISFSALNEEARFILPENINLEKCEAIVFQIASQNGPVNFYLGSNSTKIETYYYNVGKTEYTKAPTKTNKVNTITVQCGGTEYTENASVVLTGVTFIMEGKEPLPTPVDGVYNMNYFTVDTVEGVIVEANSEAGTVAATFAAAGDELLLEVPDSVDLSHLTSIVVNGTGVENVLIEVLDKNMKTLVTAGGNTAETKCNPEVKYIRLTSMAANVSVNLNNVTFNVDPDAFEAIVLNGDFSREDVSMWGAAIWGSVDGVQTEIIARESETPIYDDIYTYGEITKRSSPYVCFAQEITDRVEPGKAYNFSFASKLSDDYIGAPDDQIIVQFAPYYIDTNGQTHYSMKLSGLCSRDLSTTEWRGFAGTVYIPEDAAAVYIRIIEQGTNYGKGLCVKGSYYVADVKMSEYTGPAITYYAGGGSGGGGSANTTITKDANYIVEYNMEDMTIDWASATTDKIGSTGLNLIFDGNYDQVRIKLPRALDMSTAAYVKVNISSQNVPIAVKLYYKGTEVDVGYYNDIKSVYTLVPKYTGMIDAIGIMSLATPNPADAYANFESVIFGLTEEPAPIPVSKDIVVNGDFADEDLSDWMAAYWGQGDGVKITHHTSSKPIADGVYNYISYSKRTSPYQCFAQDITDKVEEGEIYTFSFWAKLSDDYMGAPDSQRVVQFAPYTVDKDGNADYNPKLDGTYLQVLEPGVWTYFEGTYKVTNPNNVSQVVIRILEQGTEYGKGDCVLGSYSIADVKMEKYIPEPPSIDEDVPNLKDALTEEFGEGFIAGTAISIDEVDDIGIEMLVNKHFNAVTLGNELKPDALFNYSNSQHTELKTVTFNGVTMEVPTLYFNRAEEILDKILEWNEANPDSQIKVRGHVLVWHSQTPEWFFRENYTVGQNADGTENYVSAEEMSLRLEWYISTIFEHFLGEDSKYKDLFYGWDVVNEAVSNGGNGYRTDTVSSVESPSADTHSSNSSWWAVYQSNEFIIKAFQYANKYAPADVELYYNDYNECDNKKVAGIVKLLKDVKEAEGTRIDGMGMQAHYNMFNPSVKSFEYAVRSYAEVVGKVQITEFDMKASGDISSDSAREAEYLSQAERYRDFYEVLRKLNAEEGIEITGITFWGVIDSHSWLQDSSDVGGGSDGTLTQCPLLFDGSYKVKPAFWAFVDYSVIDPDYVAPTLSTEKEEVVVEDPVAEDDKVDESVEDVTTEPAEPTAEPVQETSSQKNNVLPIAIGGGVVGVGIVAGLIAWFKKRKKDDNKNKAE